MQIQVGNEKVDAKQFRSDWAVALMQQGVIVKLRLSRWRASSPLRSEDLGLRFADNDSMNFMKRYVTLGSEKLLPPEVLAELSTLENKARACLSNYSFDTVWGKFLPYSAFNQWEFENKKIKDKFYEAARALGERYPQIIDIVKAEYRNMARDVWSRLYPEGNSGPTEAFVDNFVGKVIDKIPSSSEIVSSFKYEETYFTIPLPSFIEKDISEAEKIKREREEANFRSELEKDARQKIANHYVEKQSELIDSFLESTVKNMRGYIGELCDEIIQSIHKGNRDVNKFHIKRIKKMVEKVKLLNFYDDKEITELLSELESEVEKFKGERDDATILHKLRKIVDTSSEEFTPTDFNPAIGYLEV